MSLKAFFKVSLTQITRCAIHAMTFECVIVMNDENVGENVVVDRAEQEKKLQFCCVLVYNIRTYIHVSMFMAKNVARSSATLQSVNCLAIVLQFCIPNLCSSWVCV